MPFSIVSLYRARLAKEQGSVRKDWGGKIPIALAYPNSYRIGMSNLGFQTPYQLFNKKDNVVAERFFMPEGSELSHYLETGKEILSIESQAPLQRFELIAFSLSFENDYPNILRILELGKVPLLSAERGDSHPFIIAGGINTFLNPEPLSPFFDFFLIGEAEAILDGFLELFAAVKKKSGRRHEILKILARQGNSLYVPSLYEVAYGKDGTIQARQPVENGIPEKIKVARQDPADTRIALSSILAPETEFADRTLIELGRGCGRSCRFCATSYVYRPPRIHPESDLRTCIEKRFKNGSLWGLLSPAISDTPGIERLTGLILEKGGRFSVSSLRADTLTEGLLENLKKAGQKTVAIAPEAGSERLRKVVNKHLSEDQILTTVRLIAGMKDFRLRLYFLIGLPSETHDDIAEILELVKKIKHHMIKESKSRGSIGQIILSVNCFIPKPFTPFQWFPMENTATLKEKQKWLKKKLSREGGVKINFDLPKWAYLQALFSLGDRRIGPMLLLSHRMGGDWMKAFRASEFNPDFFVYRGKKMDEVLPWDFIDHGIHKEYLIKEYKMALKEQESEECHVGECERCGVCKPRMQR